MVPEKIKKRYSMQERKLANGQLLLTGQYYFVSSVEGHKLADYTMDAHINSFSDMLVSSLSVMDGSPHAYFVVLTPVT